MSDDIATGAAERVHLMELAGTGPPVTLHKLISKGERLEIATGDEAIKLDAVDYVLSPAGIADYIISLAAPKADNLNGAAAPVV